MKYENMGSLISELRKQNNMTQKDLAEKLNVTDKAVSKWERGISYPDINTIPDLAKILNISTEELMNIQRENTSDKIQGENINNIITLIFKAVGLAMGIATLVLSILEEIDVKTAIILLSIGLTCMGIIQINNKSEKPQ